MKKIEMQMHNGLLHHTIFRQASSLSKAILEGVMNAVDAGADKCEVQLEKKSLVIADNGRGIKTHKEVVDNFATMGTPHSEDENKVYGEFRLGRGQLFAYGKNHWRTGKFLLVVDAAKSTPNKPPEVIVKQYAKEAEGTKIEIDLYSPLSDLEQFDTLNEIKRMCAYVNLQLTINGDDRVSKFATTKWSKIDDLAYYLYQGEGDAGRCTVYNMGVLCNQVYLWDKRNCTVVSRKPLKVNVARNQVNMKCPVFSQIAKRIPVLEQSRELRLRNRREVISAWRSFHRGQMSPEHLKQFVYGKQVELTNGQLVPSRSLFKETYRTGKKPKLCVSDRGSLVADRAMQMDLSLRVVSRSFLAEIFQQEADAYTPMVLPILCEQLNSVIRAYNELVPETHQRDLCSYDNHNVIKESQLSELYPDVTSLVPERQASKRVKAMLCVARVMLNGPTCQSSELVYEQMACNNGHVYFQKKATACRKLMLGSSSSALAWTDGAMHIVLAQEYLERLSFDLDGLTKLASTLVHELCHDESSSGTHEHGLEFYKLYHDNFELLLPRMLVKAVKYVLSERFTKKTGVKLNKTETRQLLSFK